MANLFIDEAKTARQMLIAATESPSTPPYILDFLVKALNPEFPNERKACIAIAAQSGQLEKLALLVELGAEIDDLIRPLALASENGHCDCVEYLLSLDVNYPEKEKYEAAQLAANSNHVDILKLILQGLNKRDPGFNELIDKLGTAASRDHRWDIADVLTSFGFMVD